MTRRPSSPPARRCGEPGRTLGNREPVDGTSTGGGVQVSDPSDRFEQAAAANADRVMSQPAPAAPVQRDAAAAGAAVVQREAAPEEEEVQASHDPSVQREEEEEEQTS